MVKEVMRHVIANVTKDAAAEHGCGEIPVPEKERMSNPPEGGRKSYEQGRRHDQTVFVHRKVVVDAVEKEVHGEADPVVRQPSRGWVFSKTNCSRVGGLTRQGGTGNGARGIRSSSRSQSPEPRQGLDRAAMRNPRTRCRCRT